MSGRRNWRRRSGFTLVELIVVVGVMAMLLGLSVSASVAVLENSRVARTEVTLKLLDMAVQEWELESDRKLTWWHKGDTTDHSKFDVHWNTQDVMIISEILPIIQRAPGAQTMLARIETRFIHTYLPGEYPAWIGDDPRLQYDVDGPFAGTITVLDAWDTPIYATHPGRLKRDGDVDATDVDGTVRTRNEHTYGVSRNRRLTFVSAGPDVDFGRMWSSDGDRFEATLDNLYSTPVWGPSVVLDDADGGGYGGP